MSADLAGGSIQEATAWRVAASLAQGSSGPEESSGLFLGSPEFSPACS